MRWGQMNFWGCNQRLAILSRIALFKKRMLYSFSSSIGRKKQHFGIGIRSTRPEGARNVHSVALRRSTWVTWFGVDKKPIFFVFPRYGTPSRLQLPRENLPVCIEGPEGRNGKGLQGPDQIGPAGALQHTDKLALQRPKAGQFSNHSGHARVN